MKKIVSAVLMFALGIVIAMYKDSLLAIADGTRPDRPEGLTAPSADQILADVRKALANPDWSLPDETNAHAVLKSRVTFLVQYGFVDELDDLATTLRDPKLRFPSGYSYLDTFYRSATDIGIGADDTYINFYRYWAKRKPDSVTAHIALADAYRRWAWHARERDDRSVTDRGKPLDFAKRMLQSQIALEKAEKISDQDAHLHVTKMWLMMGLGRQREVGKAFERAVELDPRCLSAYLARTVSLLPLNGVPNGRWLEFARSAGPQHWPDGGNALFAYLIPAIQINHMAIDVEWNPTPDEPDTVAWPELQSAFRDYTNAAPESAYVLNRYARLAMHAGDPDAVAECIRRVGNQIDKSAIRNEWRWKAFKEYASMARRAVSARPIHTIMSDNHNGILDCTISEDGRMLAVGDSVGNVSIWNLETFKRAKRLPTEGKNAGGLAFSPDGGVFGAVYGNPTPNGGAGSVRFWNTSDWTSIHTLAFKLAPSAIAFSKDGRQAAITVHRDNEMAELYTVDLTTFRRHKREIAKNVHLRKPLFLNDRSNRLLTATHHTINLIDPARPNGSIHCIGTNKTGITCYSMIWDYDLSPRRDLIAIARGPRWEEDHEPGRLELWQTKDWKPRRLIPEGTIGGVKAVVWSRDGRYLFTGGQDRMVTVWDATTFEKRALLTAHRAVVSTLALSPDGRHLVSGSYYGRVHIWDAADILARIEAQPLAAAN